MIKITDIASTLADRHELSQADASAFVTALFSVIEDGLRTDDRQVKVKGLGTFKVTSVSPRESVDVNTGERIVIEGREKIVFTPDAVLRDRVNRPFSQFETVTLRDDVNFSEIDKDFAQTTPVVTEALQQSPEESKTATAPTPTIEENHQEPVTEVEKSVIVTEEEKPAPEEKPTAKEEEPPTETVIEETEAEPTVEDSGAAEEEKETSEEVEEQSETPEKASEPTQGHKNRLEEIQKGETLAETHPTSPDTPCSHDNENENEYDDEQPRNTLAIWLTVIIIVLLLLGGAGGGYLWHELSVRNDSIAVLQTRLIDIEERIHHASASAHTEKKEPVAPDTPSDTAAKEKAVPAAATTPDTPMTTQSKEATQPSPAASYNKDVRIRTGAYKIVGIDKTVTVKTGQTLTSIARTYLGPGMECYVEAVNENRDYKTGEQVKLPKLELKKAAKKK